ncbi:MAG: hypothetical protein CMJ75_04785 [Planctomycetaceae bacterium]|nr:hypothetical protein [Planctomycetaceae bacterium]
MFDQCPQRFFFHKRHGDKGLAGVGFADVVDHTGIGVINRPSGPRLLQETLPPFRAFAKLHRQEFDGRLSVQPTVLPQKHLSHPAVANRTENLVRTNLAGLHRKPAFGPKIGDQNHL